MIPMIHSVVQDLGAAGVGLRPPVVVTRGDGGQDAGGHSFVRDPAAPDPGQPLLRELSLITNGASIPVDTLVDLGCYVVARR